MNLSEKNQRGYHQSAEDCKDAWDAAKAFLENPDETHLFLHVGPENSPGSVYTIVKLPYGENIYLLYADKWSSPSVRPGADLKYAGFYSSQHKQTYCLQTPLTEFFEFNGKQIYEGEIQRMVKETIQKTAAEYIVGEAKKLDELPIDRLSAEILTDAETAFSNKKTVVSFSEKIPVNEYYISKTEMVEYIDNPQNVYNPDCLLKKKIDSLIESDKEKFTRLWFAHCTVQKLLDQIYEAEKKINDKE